MTYNPQITWRDVEPDAHIAEIIETSAEKMRERFGDPSSFRVVVSKPPHAQPHEPDMEFKLEMHLGGKDYIVTHESRSKAQGTTNEIAAKHAFDVLRQQITEAVEKRRQSGR